MPVRWNGDTLPLRRWHTTWIHFEVRHQAMVAGALRGDVWKRGCGTQDRGDRHVCGGLTRGGESSQPLPEIKIPRETTAGWLFDCRVLRGYNMLHTTAGRSLWVCNDNVDVTGQLDGRSCLRRETRPALNIEHVRTPRAEMIGIHSEWISGGLVTCVQRGAPYPYEFTVGLGLTS